MLLDLVRWEVVEYLDQSGCPEVMEIKSGVSSSRNRKGGNEYRQMVFKVFCNKLEKGNRAVLERDMRLCFFFFYYQIWQIDLLMENIIIERKKLDGKRKG